MKYVFQERRNYQHWIYDMLYVSLVDPDWIHFSKQVQGIGVLTGFFLTLNRQVPGFHFPGQEAMTQVIYSVVYKVWWECVNWGITILTLKVVPAVRKVNE